MQLDNMRVAIRPMSTSQAVDLGFMMARYWFLPLWTIWLGMATPVFLFYLLLISISDKSSDDFFTLQLLGIFLLWWLKPVYEKPMVLWLGQALFSEKVSTFAVIKEGWKTLFKHSFRLLITKRISFSRQFIMPILLLENVNNKQFKLRQKLMKRGQGSGVTWHTTLMIHTEFLINFALLSVIYTIIPHNFISTDVLITLLEKTPMFIDYILAFIYFITISLIAPFFVCGGFSIYLTKRCLLEGWDIELIFRQLNKRYNEAQSNPIHSLLVAAKNNKQ